MSFRFLDHTKRAAPVLETLLPGLEAERDAVRAAYGRLEARLPRADRLADEESYDVDLTVPRLVHSVGGTGATDGPVQLLGTFLPDREHFVWGWNNPSVPAPATAELKAQVLRIAALGVLPDCVSFCIPEHDLTLLAGWIALHTGWGGVYRAPAGEALTFLALSLGTPELGYDPSGLGPPWCSSCGVLRTQTRVLLEGRHGYLCEGCVRGSFHEGFEATGRKAKPNVHYAHEFSPPCLLCGEKPDEPQITFPADEAHFSLCVGCFETAEAKLPPPHASAS